MGEIKYNEMKYMRWIKTSAHNATHLNRITGTSVNKSEIKCLFRIAIDLANAIFFSMATVGYVHSLLEHQTIFNIQFAFQLAPTPKHRQYFFRLLEKGQWLRLCLHLLCINKNDRNKS